jgi:hypothetical protein
MHLLIYKSRAAQSLDKKNFRDILYTSLEQNRSADVKGALLATRRHFLQFLEGDFEAVNDTFFRIAADPRHTDIKLVSFGPVAKAHFADWRMKGFGIFDLNLELEQRLKKTYGEEEGSVLLPTDQESALSLVRDLELTGTFD